MIKPMIATPECMACHANQNVGDVIGVMDLTFSLEETDKRIQSLLAEISFTSAVLGLLTIILIFFIGVLLLLNIYNYIMLLNQF